MRLIIEYAVGDGYTWSGTITVPVEYSSQEAFAVEFEAACSAARDRGWRERPGYSFIGFTFTLADREWDYTSFFDENGAYQPPEIMTVDEWFATR